MQLIGLPDTFWVVMNPAPDSTLEDICFKVNWTQFTNLFLVHELYLDNVGAMCCHESTAHGLAEMFLRIRDEVVKTTLKKAARLSKEASAKEGAQRIKEDLERATRLISETTLEKETQDGLHDRV